MSRDLNESWQQKYPRHTSFLNTFNFFQLPVFRLCFVTTKAKILEILRLQDFQGTPNHFCAWWKLSKDIQESYQICTEEKRSGTVGFSLSVKQLHCYWLEIRQDLALSFTAFAQGRSHGVQTVFHWSYGSCWKGRGTPGMYLEGKAGRPALRCPCEQRPCSVHLSDNAFLHSSAEEVEANQRVWCLLVKWLNTPSVRSFSHSQNEDSDIKRLEEVDL